MRFLHTADWHLGRIFYGQYLTDDQAHVLENQFFSILKDEKIDGILLAGDVFDRAVLLIELLSYGIPSLPVSLWIIRYPSSW